MHDPPLCHTFELDQRDQRQPAKQQIKLLTKRQKTKNAQHPSLTETLEHRTQGEQSQTGIATKEDGGTSGACRTQQVVTRTASRSKPSAPGALTVGGSWPPTAETMHPYITLWGDTSALDPTCTGPTVADRAGKGDLKPRWAGGAPEGGDIRLEGNLATEARGGGTLC
jgi:hypothetical protein